MTKKYPAPWNLKGNGYIFLYRFNNRVDDSSYPDFLKNQKFTGFGTVMAVDYHESNAGPYRELLYIPGMHTFQHSAIKRKTYAIPRIYVSTMESVENGRRNWGIPKERADFDIQKKSSNEETFRVYDKKGDIFKAELKKGWLPFPIHSALFPLPLTQILDGKIYLTKLKASGTGYLAKAESIIVNHNKFPNIDVVKPMLIIKIENFNMQFLKADIFDL